MSTAVALALGGLSGGALAGESNFTMLDGGGGPVGGTNDVTATWDGTVNAAATGSNVNMTLSSTTAFFGNQWTAHDIRVFGPGTYTFEASPNGNDGDMPAPSDHQAPYNNPLTMTVGQGQIGAHMLFDWSTTSNIDVVNVWNVAQPWNDHSGTDGDDTDDLETGGGGPTPDVTQRWSLVSTDDDGDNINGVPMPDGPFAGFNANFSVYRVVAKGNFTMLDAGGGPVGGTNDVTVAWDGSVNTQATDTNVNMTLSSTTAFFGNQWTAHDIRVFGPGTYTFEASPNGNDGDMPSPSDHQAPYNNPLTMTVEQGQIGAHMLFDWSTTSNIDVVNVWNVAQPWNDHSGTDGDDTDDLETGGGGPTPDVTQKWTLVSTDDNGDNINGVPMPDGPFAGFNANFNVFRPSTATGTARSTAGSIEDPDVGGAIGLWGLLAGGIGVAGAAAASLVRRRRR